jgi:hypothetical protein
MSKQNRHFISIVPVLLLVLGCFPEQKALDDVVVTGEVTDIGFCRREGDVSTYRLTIKLHARNVGANPVIISSSEAMTDFYRIGESIEDVRAKQYVHIGWVTSGPGDPKSVPSKPVSPFKVVALDESISIDLDLDVTLIGELKPGQSYIELVAENWPQYSDDYVSKITRAWKAHGVVWAHSLHAEPIPFWCHRF